MYTGLRPFSDKKAHNPTISNGAYARPVALCRNLSMQKRVGGVHVMLLSY